VVFEGKAVAGSNVFSIPISHLASGMYFLKLYDGSKVMSMKLMKE
jgi:hypothetical protein